MRKNAEKNAKAFLAVKKKQKIFLKRRLTALNAILNEKNTKIKKRDTKRIKRFFYKFFGKKTRLNADKWRLNVSFFLIKKVFIKNKIF